MEPEICLHCDNEVSDDTGYCDDCDLKECPGHECMHLTSKSKRFCRECQLDYDAGAADDIRKERQEEGF